jgi:hypothetical protein
MGSGGIAVDHDAWVKVRSGNKRMGSPKAKFSFYEKVRISSTSPSKTRVHGELGAVLGRRGPATLL